MYELLRTGRLGFYEKLKSEIPVGLVEVLKVPDVGPKKAALFWKKLGLTTVAELERAARAGRGRGRRRPRSSFPTACRPTCASCRPSASGRCCSTSPAARSTTSGSARWRSAAGGG